MARPLQGVRIGVTGTRKGAELGKALERQGARAVLGPSTAGDLPVEAATVRQQTQAILDAEPTWIACTTGMGVRSWLAATESDPNLEIAIETMLAQRRVVARGAKAEGALRAIGVRPEFIPPRELDADVVAWLAEHVQPGDVVAACLHAQPEDVFDPVRKAGATVLLVTPYRTALPEDPAPLVELIQQLLEGRLHVVTFTSPGAVRGFARIAAEHDLLERVGEETATATAVAAVGVATATEAEVAGMAVSIMPARPRTGALVKEIVWWADQEGGSRTRAFVRLDPHETAAVTDEWTIPLAPVEYEVLATIARRPLRAVANDVIATEVWGDPGQTGTIPDTVARLRDKLGEAATIRTIHGTGYALHP